MGTMETKRALDPELRLDMAAINAAIEDERVSRELSYVQVARELGTAYRTLVNWRQGRCGMNGDVLLRICLWAGRPVESFARVPADPLPGSRGRPCGGPLRKSELGMVRASEPDAVAGADLLAGWPAGGPENGCWRSRLSAAPAPVPGTGVPS
jgi:hypothetical protein